MAQGGMFKILSKKNGKRMISDDKNNETIKVTKVLQFFSDTKPEDAKLGETIRFMHNPGNGLTVYWLQGTIDKRVDKYDTSKSAKWKTNHVRVKSISVVNYWGDLNPLPETLTVNLTKNTAWSLGTEVELPTLKEDEALRFEPGDFPCDNSEDDDETTGSISVKDDENGASGRTKITPCTNESDSESLAKIRLANYNLEDDTSTVISTISDDVIEVRRLRT